MSAIDVRRALRSEFPDCRWMRVRRKNDTLKAELSAYGGIFTVYVTTTEYPEPSLVTWCMRKRVEDCMARLKAA